MKRIARRRIALAEAFRRLAEAGISRHDIRNVSQAADVVERTTVAVFMDILENGERVAPMNRARERVVREANARCVRLVRL